MKRIRKGDQVVVIAGKDKGRKGSVTRVSEEGRVFVENVNVVKRHTRANPQANQPGGIIEREASLDASNVMLLNPKTFSTGSQGYFGTGKLSLGDEADKGYQGQVQLIRIGSKEAAKAAKP